MSHADAAQAVIFRGTERGFDVIEQQVLDPAAGRLLIRTELAGICGTDVHIYETGRPEPMALGHEFTGRIVAIGDGLTTDYTGRPVEVGDLIVPHPGTPNGAYGFRMSPQAADAPLLTGGFGQFVSLGYEGTNFFKVDAPPEVAVLLEPLSIAVHCVERSRLQPGDTVIVQGTGAIGLLTIYVAKQAGAAKIIAIGGPAGRLEMAKLLGADETIDVGVMRDPAERLALALSMTPNNAGADVVFEVSGAKPAVVEGINLTRRSGMFCEAGHFIDTGEITINPNQHFVVKDLNMVAPYGSLVEHFITSRELLERDYGKLDQLVSHRIPFSRTQEGFDALLGRYNLDGRDAIKIALDPWAEAE